MNEQQLKDKIRQSIQNLSTGHPGEKVETLFQTLGYSTQRKFDLANNNPEDFLELWEGIDKKRAMCSQWRSVDFLFQLTEEEIRANSQLGLFGNQIDQNYLKSYLFLSISLCENHYTRTQLSNITREINRQSDIPIMVLFRQGEYLTLSIINRRPNQRETAKDVLEKITLIKDIAIANPHRAHLEILFDLSLPQLYKNYQFTNFDQLHDAWQKTLDTTELNKRFFKEVSNWYFWAIKNVTFPEGAGENIEIRNATSVIRLITRLIFVWFLKEKGLVPDDLFNFQRVQQFLISTQPQESTYYKGILQNLFFATLNQEMNTPNKSDHRKFRNKAKQAGGRDQNYMIHNVYRYEDYFQDAQTILRQFENIPFLNGGLFECLDKSNPDHPQQIIRIDGFSDRYDNPLVVPNFLFFTESEQQVDLNNIYGTRNKRYTVRGLINIFNSYKFTITENTPIEEEIALDPELLGKVFENLLAAYNPETNTTARKQTGSFYTPREIVDYMVDEALIADLESQLSLLSNDKTGINQRLRHLFAYNHQSHQFTDAEVEVLIAAIDNLKILDPACGSGAFPMGILHKLVFILSKLDPQNFRWKEKQIAKASEIPDSTIREKVIEDIEQAFERNQLDYGRKLYLIENCIYGVDIQPIAVQISKLRCFISLIVDQNIDDDQENRGIRPLPNLETKFVAANALIGIKGAGDFTLRDPRIEQKERELAEVRRNYFIARTPKTKAKYRELDHQIRNQISDILKIDGFPSQSAEKLASWNPYDQNASADFFDSEWMFGITNGFDIVLGNPPYVRQEKIKELKPTLKQYYDCYTGTADLYIYFYERGFQLLGEGGNLAYISSNKWFRAEYGAPLRKYIAQNSQIHTITDFGELSVFEAATFPMIFIASKRKVKQQSPIFTQVKSLDAPYPDLQALIAEYGKTLPTSAIKDSEWILTDSGSANLLKKMEQVGIALEKYANGQIYRGVLTGFNKAFVIDTAKRDELIAKDPKSAEIIKRLAVGDDVRKWHIRESDRWLIFTRRGIDINQYPAIKAHLAQWKDDLTPKNSTEKIGRKPGSYQWYEIQDNVAYFPKFDQPKIVYPDIAKESRFAFDETGKYINDTAFEIIIDDLYLLGILNSSIIWKYLCNKVAVLGDAEKAGRLRLKRIYIEKVPIPNAQPQEKSAIETLVNYIIYLTVQLKDIPSHGQKMVETAEDKLMLSYFEQIVDALVMELYLPEELHNHDKYFMRHLLSENIPAIETIKGDKMQALRQIFKRLFNSEHPIRANIYFLNSLEVVRMIRGLA